MTLTQEEKDVILKSDLTATHAKYLDKHMVFYLLEQNREKGVYDEDQINQVVMNLLGKTQLVEMHMQMCEKQDGKVPEELVKKNEAFKKNKESLRAKCEPILKHFDPDQEGGWEYFQQLSKAPVGESEPSPFNLQYLNETHSITKQHFEYLYQLARLEYDSGNYNTASVLLHYYRKIGDLDNDVEAKWGKFASETLLHSWVDCQESLKVLRDAIDNVGMFIFHIS